MIYFVVIEQIFFFLVALWLTGMLLFTKYQWFARDKKKYSNFSMENATEVQVTIAIEEVNTLWLMPVTQ